MSRSSCVVAIGLLGGDEGEHKKRGDKHSTVRTAACGPDFIGLQIKAGVWAAGDLSGSLRPCGPKEMAGSQPAM